MLPRPRTGPELIGRGSNPGLPRCVGRGPPAQSSRPRPLLPEVPMSLAKSSIQLLRIIARSHPELWELLHPHQPHVAHQPRVEFARGVQQKARAIADAAVTAAALGHDPN